MSNKNLFGIVLVLCAFFISGCGKKDTNTGNVNTNYLKVTIDGRDKNFSDVQARWVDGGNFLEVNATDNGSEWLTFTVMSETTRVPAGQYSLDDGSGFTILSVHSIIDGNGQLHHTATRETFAPEDAFSLRIDKIDNSSAEGSFSGVLVRAEGQNTLGTVTLSGGQFKVAIKPN